MRSRLPILLFSLFAAAQIAHCQLRAVGIMVEGTDEKDLVVKLDKYRKVRHVDSAGKVVQKAGTDGRQRDDLVAEDPEVLTASDRRQIFVRHDARVILTLSDAYSVLTRSASDTKKVNVYEKSGEIQPPDDGDYVLEVRLRSTGGVGALDVGNAEAANPALYSLGVQVAHKAVLGGVALTGVALRAFSPASGYSLTPVYTESSGTFTLSGQRIDRSYSDRFDFNFSTGLQFVPAEDSEMGKLFVNLFSFGLDQIGGTRAGIMLSINQPTDGGNASLRLGPIVYLDRDMDVAITYGLEAFQADRFSSTYSFGQSIGKDASIDANLVKKKWLTGFYLGFVYKIGK